MYKLSQTQLDTPCMEYIKSSLYNHTYIDHPNHPHVGNQVTDTIHAWAGFTYLLPPGIS